MNPSQIIVLATPVFLLLIALEFAWELRTRRGSFGLADAINSLSLGILSQISAVFTRLLRIGLYTAVAGSLSLVPAEAAQAFWTSWYGWLLALLFYDFCYYWHHRLGHEVGVLWAAHVVHHQSEHYNLTTALRQTSTGALLGWVFYLPMALAGVPPLVFGVVALVDLLYQFWVHTEHVPRLGWFDRWFCSPSNHRVHHAVNDRYLDRNYGGVLIVWDRVFGAFCEEDPREPGVYGTRAPLRSWAPLWANAEVYAALARDAWHTRRWSDKLRVWLKPPGWRPADVAARFPKPPFDITRVQRFAPPMHPGVAALVVLQFVALLALSLLFLWHAEGLSGLHALAWFAALTAGLWANGAAAQGRIHWLEMLGLDAAALATASSATGWVELHLVSKPLALLIALIFVATSHRLALGLRQKMPQTPPQAASAGVERSLAGLCWLLAALAASLAGDVALMLPGLFIVGLGAFLLAHLAYLVLLRRDAPWFASKAALAGTLAAAAGVYAVLWAGGLPEGLRLPVAVYTGVIALMAAQALGRARTLGDGAAGSVAIGACCFMLSDGLLAYNRFVQPLPAAQLAVLGSYYAAQWLIVGGWVRGRR
ncbi:lysoplasmalogenase family protein [Tibeticola sp.]|uniref:lysoplasmalogenase family protein n=1 Tax=Tibeticola sp. TaxID=2005368 RepID=UPI0025F1708E|nr:lysoplasmalogenase family protein [Tibeticola sp.]